MDESEELSIRPTAPAVKAEDNSVVDEAAAENAYNVALMERVRDGDIPAFEELVSRHQHAVIGTVAKMLGSPNEAEDIGQQVFIRIWKSAKRYQAKAKFTTWMFTITRNLVFNEMRRRQRKPAVSMNEREEEFHIATPDESVVTPAEAALQHELEGGVRFDRGSRGRYSTDASIYQVTPLGVAFPKNSDDIRRIVEITGDAGVSITPRGGGTSQGGQCIGRPTYALTATWLAVLPTP